MGLIVGKLNKDGVELNASKTFIKEQGLPVYIIEQDSVYSLQPLGSVKFKKSSGVEILKYATSGKTYYMGMLLCMYIEKNIKLYKSYTKPEIDKLVEKLYPVNSKTIKSAMDNIRLM